MKILKRHVIVIIFEKKVSQNEVALFGQIERP